MDVNDGAGLVVPFTASTYPAPFTIHYLPFTFIAATYPKLFTIFYLPFTS